MYIGEGGLYLYPVLSPTVLIVVLSCHLSDQHILIRICRRGLELVSCVNETSARNIRERSDECSETDMMILYDELRKSHRNAVIV